MHKVDGVLAFYKFDRTISETEFLDRLGHSDHLKARIIGTEHHLMSKTPVDPGYRYIYRQHLNIEFLGAVKIQSSCIGVYIRVLQHQHRRFSTPRPAEVCQTDPEIASSFRKPFKI